MKVYGTHICIDCRNYQAIQASRGFEAESWIGQPPVREEEIVEHRPCCDSCQ